MAGNKNERSVPLFFSDENKKTDPSFLKIDIASARDRNLYFLNCHFAPLHVVHFGLARNVSRSRRGIEKE